MSNVLFVDVLIIIVSVVFSVLFILQVRKLFRIKFILEKSLNDLKRLNKGIHYLFQSNNAEGIDDIYSPPTQKKICESCKNRFTFIDYSSETNLFIYTCKLTNERISLNQTCKNYQRDFHYLNR